MKKIFALITCVVLIYLSCSRVYAMYPDSKSDSRAISTLYTDTQTKEHDHFGSIKAVVTVNASYEMLPDGTIYNKTINRSYSLQAGVKLVAILDSWTMKNGMLIYEVSYFFGEGPSLFPVEFELTPRN